QRKALAEKVTLKAVVHDHRGAVLVSMLLTWVLSAAIVVVILLTPTVLQSVYDVDAATALKSNSQAIVCLTLGSIVAGPMADR
ncbi:MFS transporter, partial [Pseudomonas aeruginosa]